MEEKIVFIIMSALNMFLIVGMFQALACVYRTEWEKMLKGIVSICILAFPFCFYAHFYDSSATMQRLNNLLAPIIIVDGLLILFGIIVVLAVYFIESESNMSGDQ